MLMMVYMAGRYIAWLIGRELRCLAPFEVLAAPLFELRHSFVDAPRITSTDCGPSQSIWIASGCARLALARRCPAAPGTMAPVSRWRVSLKRSPRQRLENRFEPGELRLWRDPTGYGLGTSRGV